MLTLALVFALPLVGALLAIALARLAGAEGLLGLAGAGAVGGVLGGLAEVLWVERYAPGLRGIGLLGPDFCGLPIGLLAGAVVAWTRSRARDRTGGPPRGSNRVDG